MSYTEIQEPQVALPAQRRQSRALGILVRLALPVIVLAVGVGAYLYLSVGKEEAKSPPAEKQDIRTKVTELRVVDYPVVVRTNGIVQAHNEVSLSAEVSGLIRSISRSFEVGSYFQKDDVLVELDDRDYRTALAVAEANLLSAEAALELAVEDHSRNETLFAKNGISQAVLKQTYAAREQAAALLDSSKAAVEQAQRDLTRTKIQAPFSGRVRMKSVGVGQSVGVGTPLGLVFAVDYAEVRLPIASRELQYLDLPELATDPAVDVQLIDGITKSSTNVWPAKIVRTEGTLDENSLELFAIARIDDPFGLESGNPPLRIGQPVIGAISGKTLEDVVALPRMAVRQLDQIYLVDKDELTLHPMTIKPIWSDETDVIVRNEAIVDGSLLSTTHIVYAPEGAKVEIIPDIELPVEANQTTATATQSTATKN